MKNRYYAAILLFALLVPALIYGQSSKQTKAHPDHVPDERTAIAIGQSVLIARFGEEKVKAQLPLSAVRAKGGFWIVQSASLGSMQTGGGMAVWVNQRSGCIENVLSYMK